MAQRTREREQNGFVKPTGKKPRTWTGYFYVKEDGKRRQKSKVLGNRADLTKGQAEEKLREVIRRRKVGLPIDDDPAPAVALITPADQLFQSAAERYLELKSGDWGRKMHGNLKSIFKTHLYPALGNRTVGAIKPSDIKAFFNQVASRGSESLVKACVTYTRGVFEMLIDDGVLIRNPARRVGKPKKTRKVSKEFLLLTNCARLLRAAEDSPKDHLILRILLGCALRPSELFALRLGDVRERQLRIDEAFVPVDGLKDTKTIDSDGFVPISPSLAAELREYINAKNILDPNQYLFPTEIGTAMSHDNYLARILKPIAKRAGLRVNFQILRRTVATHLQDHGQPKSAQALLRHAEVETTLKHYQQVLDANVIATAESWDAAICKDVEELERILALEINDGVVIG